jgi:ABC-type sugar transport system substrate-binding protein
MFENVVQSGYDGICVTIFDGAAFAKGIQAAKDKGIVVASFNIDGDWGKRSTFAYSGSDMYQQGYDLGEYFFKDVMKGKGKYILIPAIQALDVLVLRMDGIKKAAEAYPDIELIRTVEIGTDLGKAYSVVENAYTANPDVTAFIGTDFFSEAMANFISVRKLKGKVSGACFDVTPGILKHLNSGAIQCTTDQNPYLQGFYAVMQMYLKIAKDQPGQELNTGSTLITKANMGPFLDYYGMGE